MTVISHIGNTIVSLLYLAPMVIIVAVLVVSNIRDRRRGDDDDTNTDERTDPDEGHEP